jgi:6-phosphofructokinase 1
MGRHTGYIALAAGIAGGAEAVLIPEQLNDNAKLISLFQESKKAFSIVIVAEGDEDGGAVKTVEKIKQVIPDFDPRITILGHIQRGGSPTAFDRVMATRLGNAAVEALMRGESCKAVGLVNNQVVLTSLADAITLKKKLNPELLRLIDVLNV